MKKTALLVMLFLLMPMASWAASEIMEGDYVKTAVSDNGTLGYGSSMSPGIMHDTTGSGTFGVDDYLTPGTPWEMFAVSSEQTGNLMNNNTSPTGGSIAGSIVSTSSASADNYVRWEGTSSGYFDIAIDTYFNNGDERISFTTQITALSSLTNLNFLRALDPDPDVNTYGDYNTVNNRGYDVNNDGDYDDTGDIAPKDWVHAEGLSTGLTIGLYTDSDLTHNTGISSYWSTLAATYLGGVNDGNGDYSIGLAFALDELLSGESVSFDYAYVMGGSLGTVDLPGDDPASVPEPGTLVLLGSGLAGLAFYRRKRMTR